MKAKNPNCAFFSRTRCRVSGKIKIDAEKKQNSICSPRRRTKIGGPNGIGFYIYKEEKPELKVLFFGGGQERGIRSGTHNVAGIFGIFLKACEIKQKSMQTDREKLREVKKIIEESVKKLPYTRVNSPEKRLGIHLECVVYRLKIRGNSARFGVERHFFVSSGSACSSRKNARQPRAGRYGN
ncbi:MAG: aminotransferase class V-fold PLP-dependent enzyme [Clostridiales bacterium]|nr:MAG: aminotransferase class V-fold PLP-dependent enzyme [Clostridiales bacterium]